MDEIVRQNGIIHVKMPRWAKVISAAAQKRTVAIWYQCAPFESPETRRFKIIPTGADIEDGAIYIGTASFEDGDFILHVYEAP